MRTPFFGGVEYFDEETGLSSLALYPTTETEFSARKSGQLKIVYDDLGLWPAETQEFLDYRRWIENPD